MFIYLRPRILAVLILGFVSGLPLALTASTLTAMLTDYGVSISIIGGFALVGVSYSWKFLWAPFIDNARIPFFSRTLGHRKSWLLLTQIALILTILSVVLIDPRTELKLLATTAFILAFLSASQDIIIDAFRIELLKYDEQGAGAAIIILGYRLGMLASSAGALSFAHYFGWQYTYFVMAMLMLLGAGICVLFNEPSAAAKKQERISISWFKNSFIGPFAEFFKREQSLLILLFAILYKLSDAYAGVLTTPFLLKLGFDKLEIAAIVKTYGFFATILGAFLGGYLVERIGMKKALIMGGILQVLSNLAFLIQYQAGHNNYVLMMVISIENFTGGIGTAALVAYLSSLCNIKFTATQYALLSSFVTFARSTLSSSSGLLEEQVGWAIFFIISAALSLPAILLLKYIRINKRSNAAAPR